MPPLKTCYDEIVPFSECHFTTAEIPRKDCRMNQLVQQLDEKLRTLDPLRARQLEPLVREAMDQVEKEEPSDSASTWPFGYFEATAGAFAGEEFERPPQGDLPRRDDW